MMGRDFSVYAGLIFGALPFFLIYAVGACLAAVRWQQHPKVSRLCLAGFGCMILGLFITAGMNLWTISAVTEEGLTQKVSMIISASSVVRFGCDALGWGFLMFALFGGRKEA